MRRRQKELEKQNDEMMKKWKRSKNLDVNINRHLCDNGTFKSNSRQCGTKMRQWSRWAKLVIRYLTLKLVKTGVNVRKLIIWQTDRTVIIYEVDFLTLKWQSHNMSYNQSHNIMFMCDITCMTSLTLQCQCLHPRGFTPHDHWSALLGLNFCLLHYFKSD